eukprot:TRINITY_DN5054_c0_g2_i3.p1 TRINITY_DN5054_c0_g2~~TRINITY_DN5054_c0_g2_i3.p1  ORF type:complete len:785 (+),score=277.27 TRINITY_DN5054_c0_g2_i3:83-2437(+)
MAISRVVAVTEDAVYKIPQTATVTGILRQTRWPLSGLRKVVTDCSGESHNVTFYGRRGEDGPEGSWTIQFRPQEERRRKELLLILFHLAPDLEVLGTQKPHAAPTPDTAPIAVVPQPSSPRLPSSHPPQTTAIAGDLTLAELRKLIPVVLRSSPADDPKSGGSRRGSAASEYPQPDCVEVGEQRDGYQPTPAQHPLTPAAVSFSESPARSGLARVDSVSVPECARSPSADTARAQHASPSPRRVSFVQPPGAGEEVEHEQTLSLGDLVEVRDSEGECWRGGRVTRLLTVPRLVPAPGDRFGRFLVIDGPTTHVLIAPDGTEQAFTWKFVRVPDAEELERRRRDRMEAEEAERKRRAEQEERCRIHDVLRSRETRLAERLRDEAEERAAVAARIRSRQPKSDPRIQLARQQLRQHNERAQLESVIREREREAEGIALRSKLDLARHQAVTDMRIARASSLSPLRAQWSPRRTVPEDLVAEAAAVALAHADEALVAALPVDKRGTSAEAALVGCHAQQTRHQRDMERLRKRAEDVRCRDLGGDVPGDRMLLGELHEQWLRWRRSHTARGQERWSDEDTAKLARKLRTLASKMAGDCRNPEHVARVKRMADAALRSVAPHRPPELLFTAGRRVTASQPFSLSECRRPKRPVSHDEFNENLHRESVESRRRLALIRAQHESARREGSVSSVQRGRDQKGRKQEAKVVLAPQRTDTTFTTADRRTHADPQPEEDAEVAAAPAPPPERHPPPDVAPLEPAPEEEPAAAEVEEALEDGSGREATEPGAPEA